MNEAREDAVWALNLARVHNKAIEQAARHVWGLRNEGRYVLLLTKREINILRKALGEKLSGGKLVIRDQIDGALDDEDSTGLVVDEILALVVPFRSDEVEAQYDRRYVLIKKMNWPDFATLTPEEEIEYKQLNEELDKLPHGYDIKHQEAIDSILEAAELLKRGRA